MDNKKLHPWEQCPDVWKSESAYWSWVRGGLRAIWSKHPVKNQFVKEYRTLVPNPNPKGRKSHVSGMTCSRCNGEFIMPPSKTAKKNIEAATGEKLNCIETNHKVGAGSLKSKEDLGRFAANLLYVCFEDLEPLCRECHGVVTYAERYGVSERDAEIEKEVVAICNKGRLDLLNWLEQAGVEPASNAKLRKEQVRGIIREQKED